MWGILNRWFNRNKAYLATVLLVSVLIGAAVAVLTICWPPTLAVFAAISVFGWTPLAFLSSLNVFLASLSLSSIVTGCAFVVATGSAVLVKQVADIIGHIYKLFTPQELISPGLHPDLTEFILDHLDSEQSNKQNDDEDYDEFMDYESSESFMDEQVIEHTKMVMDDLEETHVKGMSL